MAGNTATPRAQKDLARAKAFSQAAWSPDGYSPDQFGDQIVSAIQWGVYDALVDVFPERAARFARPVDAPPEGRAIRLAYGDEVSGKWHISAGWGMHWRAGQAPEPVFRTFRIETMCGKQIEVEQGNAWTPEQGGRPRSHVVTAAWVDVEPLCQTCSARQAREAAKAA